MDDDDGICHTKNKKKFCVVFTAKKVNILMCTNEVTRNAGYKKRTI